MWGEYLSVETSLQVAAVLIIQRWNWQSENAPNNKNNKTLHVCIPEFLYAAAGEVAGPARTSYRCGWNIKEQLRWTPSRYQQQQSEAAAGNRDGRAFGELKLRQRGDEKVLIHHCVALIIWWCRNVWEVKSCWLLHRAQEEDRKLQRKYRKTTVINVINHLSCQLKMVTASVPRSSARIGSRFLETFTFLMTLMSFESPRDVHTHYQHVIFNSKNSLLWCIFTWLCWRPLVAVVFVVVPKEEVRWSCFKSDIYSREVKLDGPVSI